MGDDLKADNLHSFEKSIDGEMDVWSVIENELRFCTVFWVFRVWLI